MSLRPPAAADELPPPPAPPGIPHSSGSGHPPTHEQAAIIDTYRTGSHLVVEALAGTGKTTTLRMLAATTPNRLGTYLVYNKAAQMEAAGRFPRAVNVVTAHSLAYRAVGRAYAHRLPQGGRGGAPRLGAAAIAALLQVRPADTGRVHLPAPMVVRLAEATINQFCLSDAVEPGPQHLPIHARHLGPRAAVWAAVGPVAHQVWHDLCNPNGRLYFTHDHYLKIWQTGHPQINSDYILFDEAQDANPVIAAVVAAQDHCQKIYVGDRNQQLYAWRGAIDAMSHLDGYRLALTASFRFGPAIAENANRWLRLLESPLQLEGRGPAGIITGAMEHADAILCRGNGTAIEYILGFQERGIKVGLAPGDRTAGADIRAFAFAARDLQAGRGTDHMELSAFKSWADLCAYADEEESGKDLKRMIGVINRVGVSRVIDAVQRLTPREQAEVMVSTAHKAKGLEWDRVRVADDFTPPLEGEKPDPAELMLAYVTVTRAKRELAPGSLDPANWAGDGWDDEVARTAWEDATWD
jgi:hypothetical protein